eukprot:scaffold7103_cov39-Tisochrysis_lutea.AAC.1
MGEKRREGGRGGRGTKTEVESSRETISRCRPAASAATEGGSLSLAAGTKAPCSDALHYGRDRPSHMWRSVLLHSHE